LASRAAAPRFQDSTSIRRFKTIAGTSVIVSSRCRSRAATSGGPDCRAGTAGATSATANRYSRSSRSHARRRERVEDRAGGPAGPSLLQPHDVVDAHVRELGQLFTTQSRHPAKTTVVGQTRPVRGERSAARAQEIAQLSATGRVFVACHDSSVRENAAACLVLACTGRTVPDHPEPPTPP
jgi:hypothetical protein